MAKKCPLSRQKDRERMTENIEKISPSHAPGLTAAEMQGLLRLAQRGDGEARETLISANLPLVRHVVRRFQARQQDPEDLFQIGVIGLIKAIDRFNLAYGVCFSTYAVPMIMGEIRRAFRDDQQIKVGRANQELAYKIKKAQAQFIEKNGYEPSIMELSRQLDVERETLVVALSAAQPLSSLQEPVYQKDGNVVYLEDQLALPEDWQQKSELKEALNELEPRLKQLILLRYFHGKTQAEIGKLLGISQVQISRLEKKALAQLKNMV